MLTQYTESILDKCLKKDDCFTHQAVLQWCSACTAGWDYEATNTVEGSSIYNACVCGIGYFQFNGSTTISLSGPEMLIDTILIWGTNMDNAAISVNGGEPIQGSGVPSNCQPCGSGKPEPIAIELPVDPDDSEISALSIEITGTGIICIDRLFVGRKLFIYPKQDLGMIHLQNDREVTRKKNKCGGTLVVMDEQIEVPAAFELPRVPYQWAKDTWSCYLAWAQRYGFIMRWSINNCQNDVFWGQLDQLDKPTFGNKQKSCINIPVSATGFICPPEIKKAA